MSNAEEWEIYDRHKNTIDEATKSLIQAFSEPDPHPTDPDEDETYSYLSQADAMLRGLLAEASVDGAPLELVVLSQLIEGLTSLWEIEDGATS